MCADKIEVENINTPGRSSKVDAAKYRAMHDAMMAVLPTGAPGLSAEQIEELAKPHLPQTLFPGGATSGWWSKTVQLDLEAKGVMQRHATKPLTFSKV